MKTDNTPTGKDRRKKYTPHQRLRLQKAKDLKEKGELRKARRSRAKEMKSKEAQPKGNTTQAEIRIPKLKKNELSQPTRPPARFRRRQVHKQWLPTHVWHAKRAHMTEPKDPLWRFSIPLTPTEKCYRTTQRAGEMRGCVASDTSYMATIGLQGVERGLLGLLRSVGAVETILNGKTGAKWRNGTRGWEGWISERDGSRQPIAPVKIIWCTPDEDTPSSSVSEESRLKRKRKMLLRVHPSAFFQVWNEIVKVAKMQRPPAMVEDLRFEVGSIEVTGPGSTEALIAALRPVSGSDSSQKTPSDEQAGATAEPTHATADQDEWEDIPTPQALWPKLTFLTNPSALPLNAVLAFNITDPRLHHPPQTIAMPSSDAANSHLLPLLASWPPDQTQACADIFSRKARLTASRRLPSQKAINRRKSLALPGSHPPPASTDPSIPILLLASRPSIPSAAPPTIKPKFKPTTQQGTWTILLPWDCVVPVWYTLLHYPLSTGGNPRFGGLREQQQLAFSRSLPWFPGDYPGTSAGWAWELREREAAKRLWDRKPRGRRLEYDSVPLGDGRKGEIGMGWACDWERLVMGKPDPQSSSNAAAADRAGEGQVATAGKAAAKGNPQPSTTTISSPPSVDPTPTLQPPHNIHHLSSPDSTSTQIPANALTPIHITPVNPSPAPSRTARIYRLPTNAVLREKWLALLPLSDHPVPLPRTSTNLNDGNKKHQRPGPNAPQHIRDAALAQSILAESDDGEEQPEGTIHGRPPVPGEEDLIGFVTSGGLRAGKGCAIGNILVAKALAPVTTGSEADATANIDENRTRDGNVHTNEGGSSVQGAHPVPEDRRSSNNKRKATVPDTGRGKGNPKGKGTGKRRWNPQHLCIIRESGQPVGRLCSWSFAA